jgi:hypothetical protein
MPPAEPMAAPQLTPLAAAKLKWQPSLKWCQKELKEARWMDPKVRTAVEQFHSMVQAVLGAPDAAEFHAAQSAAAAQVRQDPFLRWAPLPSPLPKA